MASGGNAIFTEVLQIGIDTSQFAAQMKQVEQIYMSSLNAMNTAGGAQGGGVAAMTVMGTQMQKLAQDMVVLQERIAAAAESIETNVITMANKSTVAMGQMGNAVKRAGSTMSEGQSIGERFGNALTRAFIRVPAMAAASAALAVALGAILAPLKFLKDGFDNLGDQTPVFKQLHTELANTFSVLESVAAKPIFDLVVSAMKELNNWLKQNKGHIEEVLFLLGRVIADGLRPLIEMMERPIAMKGLLLFVTLVASAITNAIQGAKLLVDLLVDAAKLNPATGSIAEGGPVAFVKNFKKNLDTAFADVKQDFKDAKTSLKDEKDAFLGILDDSSKFTGKEPLAHNQLKTSAEIMADFRNALDQIKERTKETTDAIEEQVKRSALSKVAAKPMILAADAEEKKSIDELIKRYEKLLATATDLTQLDSSKMRTQIEKLLRGGNRAMSPYADANNRDKQAREQAAEEQEKIALQVAETDHKIADMESKARIEIIKREVAEGKRTREEGVDAEIAANLDRHTRADRAIAEMPGEEGTEAAAKRDSAARLEEAQNLDTVKKLQAAKTQAHDQDTDAVEKNREAMAKYSIALKVAEDGEAKTLGLKQRHIILTREIIDLKLQEAQAELAVAQAKAKDDAGTPEAMKDQQKIAALQAEIAVLKNEQHNASQSGTALGKYLGDDEQQAGDVLKQSLHLDDVATDMSHATTAVEKFAVGLEGATDIVKGIANAIQGAVQGYQKGGGLGAAGSLLQNDTVTGALGSGIGKLFGDAAGNLVPVIGPMIGQMFTAITGLFSMGIQNMVTAINNKISDINNAAKLQQITLSQQIQELQEEKQDAINQLGGSKKKGAKKELDSILRTLNTEIADLKKQQHDIIVNFESVTRAMSLGTPIMDQWYQTWKGINDQVKQYVDAGGSLATAAQFLNIQLQRQRQDMQNQLNAGEQTAINDAIQLNQLITQRVQMLKDEAKTEFEMQNADSMERRTSNAVKVGMQLQIQRQQFQLQILDLNNQIDLENQKVNAETKIFDINKSLADLRARSNALTIDSLNQQLAKYQDMAKLLAATQGLVFGPGNIPTAANAIFPTPGEPSVNGGIYGTNIGTVNININGAGKSGSDLADEISRNLRGLNSNFNY